ncbi:MAG: hypothetical protein A2Y81_03785 [Nitrospirae bacterium RBG_13_43_8]|nr:MAG: hypothetical protein A2Y81_03785 [Nitrospirae bacterium RBG_13_43_8]
MKKEKIKDREFATNSVPMAVIFLRLRRIDRKIQILSLDSPIESGNDGIKKTSQKDLERFLRCLSAHSIKLNSEFSRIDSV